MSTGLELNDLGASRQNDTNKKQKEESFSAEVIEDLIDVGAHKAQSSCDKSILGCVAGTVAVSCGWLCCRGCKVCCRKKKNAANMEKEYVKSNEMFSYGGAPNELTRVARAAHKSVSRRDHQRKVCPFMCNCHGNEKLGLKFNEERRRCLEARKLFEDPEFPADDESLFKKQDKFHAYPSTFRAKHGGYEWLRPAEIVDSPQFVVGGQSRFDAMQGWISDCCLCAGVSTLATNEDLLYRVVPLDQSFTDNYAGIFHFQFWHYGEWIDVVIDDRLPTCNGLLVFMRSEQKNEFWSALLEKAYAKLWGSYEALCDGFLEDVMEDLTGGVVESLIINQCEFYSFKNLVQSAYESGATINCGIEKGEARTEKGLIGDHAYSVTNFAKVSYCGGVVTLIRLRNPWGSKQQWTGPFGDKSLEWEYVSKEDKKRLLVVADDGEFWMLFEDFVREFSTAHICILGQDCIDDIRKLYGSTVKRRRFNWLSTTFHGEWSARKLTAGGLASGNIACNPQYSVRVKSEGNRKTVLVIEVMQKHEKEIKGIYYKKVGFAMVRRKRKLNKVQQDTLDDNAEWTVKPTFRQGRQKVKHIHVLPGDYVIIVSTENGNQDGEFLLRILSSGKIDVRQFV